MAAPVTDNAYKKGMPRSRARQACMRCRRQKLRCDNVRPCTLCVRSSVTCQDVVHPKRKRAAIPSLQSSKTSTRTSQAEHTQSKRIDDTPSTTSNISPSDADFPPSRLQVETCQHSRTPNLNCERSSTYGLADQVRCRFVSYLSPCLSTLHAHCDQKLFQAYDSASGALSEADAIPDGSLEQHSSLLRDDRLVPVSELIGFDLPSPKVTWMLFDVFVNSVHWFMMLFHEPSLRADLGEMLRTGRAHHRQKSQIYLVLVTLVIGARYAINDDAPSHSPEIELSKLETYLLKRIEENILELIDQNDLESVQTCVLLGSLYIYHRRPKRCFIINGAVMRGAQALSLHKESAWPAMSIVEREVRRRVWWALYVCDGFGAINFGTPCTIQDGDFQVKMPQNIDDTSDTCPGFNSVELLEDGSYERVTTLTYQRLKFKLYRITSHITRDIYFHGGRSTPGIVKRVQEIHSSLLGWEQMIPPELRPSSFADRRNELVDPITKIFRLQALSLQLSYDNIQLILHRPLLVYKGMIHSPHFPKQTSPELRPRHQETEDSHLFDQETAILEDSKTQCWKSATRTSRIDEYPEILTQMRNTHTAGYIGIQALTAGVMLVIFSLSQPFSARAQEAKRGIGRLIRVPKHLGYRTAISDQTGHILEKLLRLIFAQEMKMLTADDEPEHQPRRLDETRPASSLSVCRQSTSRPSRQVDEQNTTGITNAGNPEVTQHGTYGNDDGLALDNRHILDVQPLIEGNFNEALQSLQQAFSDNRIGNDRPRTLAAQHKSNNPPNLQSQNSTGSAPMFYSPTTDIPAGCNIFGSLEDTSQGWIWDDSFQFT
ncbi:uncharacterized protein Z518_05652 [Rhinocladiella mackenziei CBS 650.93]|uniref:Zn(2)-C6 fungal-type domain-containing protein n=1 Tax=Rhinocladiella mackenziei CBS 650.93 TaxID=1442369 RepID=A0A0D2INS5_9EURO|nr:uncharacterized protein Z518_05652 [Rhinocladiella mackenziei CBS 650.93]KIX04781.1 hypothetical protein Z518_05652 [Rhinocladiella mackenziei CBS 650.93]